MNESTGSVMGKGDRGTFDPLTWRGMKLKWSGVSVHTTRCLDEECSCMAARAKLVNIKRALSAGALSFVVLLQRGRWILTLCVKIYISLESFFFEHLCNLNVESGGVKASSSISIKATVKKPVDMAKLTGSLPPSISSWPT